MTTFHHTADLIKKASAPAKKPGEHHKEDQEGQKEDKSAVEGQEEG